MGPFKLLVQTPRKYLADKTIRIIRPIQYYLEYRFFSHSDYTTFADRNTVVAKNLVVDLTERGLIAVIMPRRSKSEMCVLAR